MTFLKLESVLQIKKTKLDLVTWYHGLCALLQLFVTTSFVIYSRCPGFFVHSRGYTLYLATTCKFNTRFEHVERVSFRGTAANYHDQTI